ncbi:hypothetical protein H6P81_016969 [Aristolochia fimbriata]|uniref:Tetraspanin-10 n=1 Tax=Aristolochia fimbriata TaxID=158543 RepID=A0AAV7DYR0_ARIFI|nr:hypothetical protein H6P81_016969 [Aristolochia fimbriata]
MFSGSSSFRICAKLRMAGSGWKSKMEFAYSSPVYSEVNNNQSWKGYKSCSLKSGVCDELVERFENLEMVTTILSPVEAGCCRPPYECGYPAINASFYNLTVESGSRNNDCKLYKNSPAVKCYDCDQCKGGVLKNLQEQWLFSTLWILIVTLIVIIASGCVGVYARPRHLR